MVASTRHIIINIERMAGDDELLRLWKAESAAKHDDGTERSPQEAWSRFVQAADEAKIADRIPGSVGRSFKARYAATLQVSAETPKRASTRKATAKAASK